tara:strand:- start:3156 stop:3515 length:360 start_codon:yes stop_codon:yes gene_type:complete
VQTTEQCHAHDEDDITRKAFDLIFAYDEIIACGYRYISLRLGGVYEGFCSHFHITSKCREKVNMQQIAQYLEMDSQEERLFEMIERVHCLSQVFPVSCFPFTPSCITEIFLTKNNDFAE